MRFVAALAAALACSAWPAGAAEPRPRLEAGFGAAAVVAPAYRGSEHYGTVALPFPYFSYRGERLKLAREGLRLDGAQWSRLAISLSAAAALPGNQGKDPLRSGMPDIDPTLEIGPSLDWIRAGADSTFCLCLPIRQVTATDFSHWRPAGWVAQPQARLTRFADLGAWLLTVSGSAGAVFATRQHHAYFYGVAPQYATPERPAYQARGGYSGVRATLYAGGRHGAWTLGAGLVADLLDGAVFDDSPLLGTRSSFTLGIVVARSFWRSGLAAPDVWEARSAGPSP